MSSYALKDLGYKLAGKEKRDPIPFKDFLDKVEKNPQRAFRNIFQLVDDMIYSYLGDGINEYPDDPESINYVDYSATSLFVEGVDNPFFADRLFLNRFANTFAFLRKGTQQNMLVFDGPHGCGKSTFLKNFLQKLEEFTATEEGMMYEILWKLNVEKLGGMAELKSFLGRKGENEEEEEQIFTSQDGIQDGVIEIPCPSHDNPLLLIPKGYRKEFVCNLEMDEESKKKILRDKEYEWIFKNSSCTICSSLLQFLLDRLNSPEDAFDMLYVRRYKFDRRLGEGISVFSPGDEEPRDNALINRALQSQLNRLTRDSNRVRYVYSVYARTNNGLYVLEDIKAKNKERLGRLHGIISEGRHKVDGTIEENVNSLFIAVMNPEDDLGGNNEKEKGRGKGESITGDKSFQDRKTYIHIPYVLDYRTEVEIYRRVFGSRIDSAFLPRVLNNFAKIIVSSRLKTKKWSGLSPVLSEWIVKGDKYKPYCDKDLYLLKMQIYAGKIPSWLTEEDRARFTADIRKKIIAESEEEGSEGFSGRDSQKIFQEFFRTHRNKEKKLINMGMVKTFFMRKNGNLHERVPEGFLDSLIGLYNYSVLEEVKESLYRYNEEEISKNIQNYIHAVNFDIGDRTKCPFTEEDLEITSDFFNLLERKIWGVGLSDREYDSRRNDAQKEYTERTIPEMNLEGKSLKETRQYENLRERYNRHLKETVLDPFLSNSSFRNAIKEYGTPAFQAYDKRIRDDVSFMINNLIKKHKYTEQGAKEVCIYVIDNNLAKTFAGR